MVRSRHGERARAYRAADRARCFPEPLAHGPFYLGLIVSLFVLLTTFLRELAHFAATILTASETDVILGVQLDLAILAMPFILAVEAIRR